MKNTIKQIQSKFGKTIYKSTLIIFTLALCNCTVDVNEVENFVFVKESPSLFSASCHLEFYPDGAYSKEAAAIFENIFDKMLENYNQNNYTSEANRAISSINEFIRANHQCTIYLNEYVTNSCKSTSDYDQSALKSFASSINIDSICIQPIPEYFDNQTSRFIHDWENRINNVYTKVDSLRVESLSYNDDYKENPEDFKSKHIIIEINTVVFNDEHVVNGTTMPNLIAYDKYVHKFKNKKTPVNHEGTEYSYDTEFDGIKYKEKKLMYEINAEYKIKISVPGKGVVYDKTFTARQENAPDIWNFEDSTLASDELSKQEANCYANAIKDIEAKWYAK